MKRAKHTPLFLLLVSILLLLFARQAHSEEPEIVKADADTDYRATHNLPSERAQTRYILEISANLEDWEGQRLVFDSESICWKLDSEEKSISVTSQSASEDGVWSIEFQLPSDFEAYTRIIPLRGPNPVDSTVSEATRILLKNLHRIGWDENKIMFGQEFPLSFNRATSFNKELEQSDCKDVVGDHPGVHGADFLYMMYGNDQEKQTHIDAVRLAYQTGAVVTFDFHWRGKYSNEFYWDERDGELLYNIVHNDDSNGEVSWFYATLDEVLQLVNEEIRIPIVFRPFHEMNGDWFWWGSRMKGGSEVYRKAFQLLVDYLSENSEFLLFCWSPDKGLFTEYYPGDEYVDIIGMDAYDIGSVEWVTVEQTVGWLEDAVDFAQEHGKVAAFTETGNRVDYPDGRPNWWTESVLEPILASKKARKVAWILTWINAPWSGPYTPVAQSSDEAKADFRRFAEHPVTLFQRDVAAEDMYFPFAPTPSGNLTRND